MLKGCVTFNPSIGPLAADLRGFGATSTRCDLGNPTEMAACQSEWAPNPVYVRCADAFDFMTKLDNSGRNNAMTAMQWQLENMPAGNWIIEPFNEPDDNGPIMTPTQYCQFAASLISIALARGFHVSAGSIWTPGPASLSWLQQVMGQSVTLPVGGTVNYADPRIGYGFHRYVETTDWNTTFIIDRPWWEFWVSKQPYPDRTTELMAFLSLIGQQRPWDCGEFNWGETIKGITPDIILSNQQKEFAFLEQHGCRSAYIYQANDDAFGFGLRDKNNVWKPRASECFR